MISRSVWLVRAPQSIRGEDRGSVELVRTVPRLRGLTKVNGNEGPLLQPVSWIVCGSGGVETEDYIPLGFVSCDD